MNTKDFEQAIEALGVNGLEIITFSYQLNGGVAAVFARLDMTFLKWDSAGRGFCIDLDNMSEIESAEHFPHYLDYRRDSDFDLKFE